MCGIFGLISYGNVDRSRAIAYKKVIRNLLVASQIRGSDAAGLCVLSGSEVQLFKNDVPAKVFVVDARYEEVTSTINNSFRYAIGHTRAQTKGNKRYNDNNHPIIAGKVIGVHNGVIANDDILFGEYKESIERAGRVDSEIIFRLIDFHIRSGMSIVESVRNVYLLLSGGYSCAFMHVDNPRYVTLFRDSKFGAIVLFMSKITKTLVFASTEIIAKNSIAGMTDIGADILDNQIKFDTAIRIDTTNGNMYPFEVGDINTTVTHNNPRCGLAEFDPTAGNKDTLCGEDCLICEYNAA